jgi:hypothetical protein
MSGSGPYEFLARFDLKTNREFTSDFIIKNPGPVEFGVDSATFPASGIYRLDASHPPGYRSVSILREQATYLLRGDGVTWLPYTVTYSDLNRPS